MAGGPESVAVVVTKPRVNVYTALAIVATVALVTATVVMLVAYNRWYGLDELFKSASQA